MKITKAVKRILDNYESDSPGTKTNLARAPSAIGAQSLGLGIPAPQCHAVAWWRLGSVPALRRCARLTPQHPGVASSRLPARLLPC